MSRQPQNDHSLQSVPQTVVTITPAAKRFFQQQLQGDQAAIGIRIGVKNSGCSGYAYVIESVAAQPEDHIEIISAPCKLYLDNSAVPILAGSEIDLVKDGVNATIQFNNPNAGTYCGCGESFTVD